MKPIIAISTSFNSDHDILLRRHYCEAVIRGGGAPVLLPSLGAPADVLGCCHGLILSGGGDVAPERYQMTDYDPAVLSGVSPERDEYELELARLAYEHGMPILGICRGVQVLNVALGGTLHIDIPGHRQTLERHEMSHKVSIAPDSLLRSLIGADEAAVNSFHHQAVSRPADALRPVAYSETGIIEAVEAPDHAFCLGVQWHPEHLDVPEHNALFAGLVRAAGER